MLLDKNNKPLWRTKNTIGQSWTSNRAQESRKGNRYLVEVVILIDQLLQLALDGEYSFCWELKLHQRHSCFFEMFQEAYF